MNGDGGSAILRAWVLAAIFGDAIPGSAQVSLLLILRRKPIELVAKRFHRRHDALNFGSERACISVRVRRIVEVVLHIDERVCQDVANHIDHALRYGYLCVFSNGRSAVPSPDTYS